MTVADVKKDIQDKTIKQYYVFTGDELEVMNIFINKIAEVAGAKICRADTLSSVFSKLQNKSFFSTKTCFVIRDDKEFMSAEEIWPKIERAELQSDNIVIMLYTDVDKRSKFYKHIKDSLVTFEALTDANLKREIQKRIALSDRNCDILIDICEHNLGIILNEIDKIQKFDHEATNSAFEHLLKAGVIHQPARDCIWEFVDAVLMRKKVAAFGLLEEALEFGNPVLTLISVLYRDTKQLLQVQMCPTPDISKSTGLSGFDIKRASGRKFKYKDKELVNAMSVIREAEMGIKSGNIEESMALEYILVNMM